MTETEVKRIFAVLAWITKHHQIPNTVSDKNGEVIQCSGKVSNSEISLSLGNLYITVDRDDYYGSTSDTNSKWQHSIHAKIDNGSLLQCNVDENNYIFSGSVLEGSPQIHVDNLNNSSTEFEIVS